MSDMRETDENIIAIFLADIHLSLKPPIWRSAEPNWLEAQARPLNEIKGLMKKHKCPTLCSGDIFDRWNACPELINWAIKYLPIMYSIPGQHDLPNHRIEDIRRSAFWTLVEANVITEIEFGQSIIHEPFEIFGFPFRKDITEPYNKSSTRPAIAIVHDYVWAGEHHYSNAPKEKKIYRSVNDYGKYFGYDVIVYGDNHKGFCMEKGDTTIFNCGTLMRRKSDEINYQPQVGLLTESGKVIPHYLDISQDKYIEEMEPEQETDLNMSGFFDELEKLGKTALDFRDAIKEFMHRGKTIDEVKQIILDAMEK